MEEGRVFSFFETPPKTGKRRIQPYPKLIPNILVSGISVFYPFWTGVFVCLGKNWINWQIVYSLEKY